jgi:hypothetical protein
LVRDACSDHGVGMQRPHRIDPGRPRVYEITRSFCRLVSRTARYSLL